MDILNYDVGANLTISVVLLHLWVLMSALLFLRFPGMNCMQRKGSADHTKDEEVEEGDGSLDVEGPEDVPTEN